MYYESECLKYCSGIIKSTNKVSLLTNKFKKTSIITETRVI